MALTVGLIDRIRKRRSTTPDDEFSPTPGFRIDYGDETRFVTDAETFALMGDGRAQRTAQEQYYVLDALVDEGRAAHLPDGFAVPAEELALLQDDDAAVLDLPPRFTGGIHADVRRWTDHADFGIDLDLQVGPYPEAPRRRGPVVRAGGRLHRTSLPLLRALRAVEDHAALPPDARTETANVRLVAELQQAQRLATSGDRNVRDDHFRVSLGALDRFTTVTPRSVGILVEPQPDGSLMVEPDLGPEIDRSLVAKRWHHLDHVAAGDTDEGTPPQAAVLRADNTLVLLEPEHVAGVREVRRRPRIPADQARRLFEAPGSFYDPAVVDVDIRFSARVAGLGVIAPVTFNEAAASGIAWFGEQTSLSPPALLETAARDAQQQESIERAVTAAWDSGESVVPVGDQLVDVSDRSLVQEALDASRRRIDALGVTEPAASPVEPSDERTGPVVTVGMHILDATDATDRLRERALAARPLQPLDEAALRRSPFPHQRTGIEWMTGLMQDALLAGPHDTTRVQGALLADDMGLGKTFMTLAALAEAYRPLREQGREVPATLAVMPVALLENWLQEIESTFGTRHGPFDDVVVLQGAGLGDYRLHGATRETAASADDLDEHGMVREDRIHVALRVGEGWKEARLDRPGVLVLTTYETLRRYQVSLGVVDWGVVVLDEAQATKNPEILATRAAKGLKARFKLLATGTPVENSLRDFWSLVDTAQPGLLGTWADFQETWVKPMKAASGPEHEQLGRELREAVGPFMLRRIKEDHLENLPPKRIHEYPQAMPAAQVAVYDDVLAGHRARAGAKGAALKTLHELSAASLHPGLLNGTLDGDPRRVDDSARTLVAVRGVLDTVRDAGEKAIVFAKTKDVQRALALWLREIYGLRVDIVNGDTPATGTGDTRLTKIRAFEAVPGFNVIVLSPLAVGVGLTVVGANHAIHLERHWNPAKEAQATDRIHRIGQTREVHVHYPIALHPDVESFDINLDRLLRSKVALRDAVVVPQEVTQEELERALGL
ncbi:DEAD/DEAH box helicase [Cellulomonas xiejunii]|uniref:DEAD/DEAH box helicase n=1 Tax=Cellulomonas xiejunii TaxID=2968083 RepID=A0ABY5KLY6_9CELL|nr:DEAD/DEAH box helicase [Cellulomonas xiejunii]MCC2319545.1 DEAD/DEAH box helicase [Cellulomonas xiejunii]UUI71509.1 DEAD/DEAH box helicase [Cellulomonas xiejunii]